MNLDISKSALMIIDMQKFFVDESSSTFTEGSPAIVPNCQMLVESFRAASRPIIYTRHVHQSAEMDGGNMAWWWNDMCIDGTPESEIIDKLVPLKGDKVIKKHRYSAFYNTDLETTLRCLSIADIVFCGIMTNICVESTVRDAFFRDYRCFVPADAVGSVSEKLQIGALRSMAYGFASIRRTEDIVSDFG
ncbi:MAG: cysteine hydrolase [candidate division Zixibacteria bacterium]|nr:cysteine hydrolase [candidate division Zixibacteria bacterium]